MQDDKLIIGGHAFHSRFILGSGKYSMNLIDAAVKDAGAEIPTPIKKLFGRVAETFFIGSVTDDTLHGNKDAVSFADESRQEKYEGMFVFAVRMNDGEELTRSDAALLTRGINRIVHQQPAILLFSHVSNAFKIINKNDMAINSQVILTTEIYALSFSF